MTEEFRTIADATVAAPEIDEPISERAVLVVYYDQGPGARTRLLELPDGAEVLCGRSRACTVHIDSDRVSRNHARVFRRSNEIAVEDLGSRNGTRVNGDKITEITRVVSGDEIRMGPTTVVVNVTTRAVRRTIVGSASYLEERMNAEVDRGLRFHRSTALIMMNLAGSQIAVDASVDSISAQLHPMHVIAEYSPDEIAILAPEADALAGAELARRLLNEVSNQSFGDEPVVARAGIAAFPAHATQPGELLSRARAALRTAISRNLDDPVVAETNEPTPSSVDVVIGDPQMQRVYALVRKVADTNMTVLIVGETGVGKEVVAENVHRSSSRRDQRFVRLNCASIPETLLESELFGHERGAFTGADRRHIGYFEAADDGTIFLDEIGEISPAIQAKLLRVLEQRKITRVGGTKEITVDARVVCATNRDLESEVQRGNFREDLYFRISAFTIMVPPLRDRRDEMRLLAEYFLRQAAQDAGCAVPTLTAEATAALDRYDWPGNVRELRNAMERAVVLQDAGVIEIEHLPDRIREAALVTRGRPSVVVAASSDVREQIAEVERATIVAAMEECGGNQTHAARKLGISRRALIYKLEKYGLKKRPATKR